MRQTVPLYLSLFVVLAMSAMGLHVHDDGICHAHPFEVHHEELEDDPLPGLTGAEHSAFHPNARLVTLAEEGGPNGGHVFPVCSEPLADRILDPPRTDRFSPIECVIAHSTPIFLRQRRLLI